MTPWLKENAFLSFVQWKINRTKDKTKTHAHIFLNYEMSQDNNDDAYSTELHGIIINKVKAVDLDGEQVTRILLESMNLEERKTRRKCERSNVQLILDTIMNLYEKIIQGIYNRPDEPIDDLPELIPIPTINQRTPNNNNNGPGPPSWYEYRSPDYRPNLVTPRPEPRQESELRQSRRGIRGVRGIHNRRGI